MVLSHITLICNDLEKTGLFLKKIFAAIEHYATQHQPYSLTREKFFKIGDLWLVTMEGKSADQTYNHIAFQVDSNRFPWFRHNLAELDLEILPGRERSPEEGDSIYFYDYDNHLFELHSGNLEKRLEYYRDNDQRLTI